MDKNMHKYHRIKAAKVSKNKFSSNICIIPNAFFGFSKGGIIFLFVVLFFIIGCALPRIIVLDDPLTPEEHINLGVAYEKKGELDNALKEYKEASRKLPLAFLYIGNVYFQKNELDEAESYYKKAIKNDSQNADACNNLAWVYYTKKDNIEEAESLAVKALEINPSKHDIYNDTLEKIRELKTLLMKNLPDKCERAQE